jgi:CRISPR-associated protein (Cas_Cmr5)
MTWSLQHERLRHASEAGSRRFQKASAGDGLQEYRTLVLGSVAQLRQSGLPALVAFYLSKKGAHRHLLVDLFSWLEGAPLTQPIVAGRETPARTPIAAAAVGAQLVGALLERSDHELGTLGLEAEAYLSDLRRVIEGIYQDRKLAEAAAAVVAETRP